MGKRWSVPEIRVEEGRSRKERKQKRQEGKGGSKSSGLPAKGKRHFKPGTVALHEIRKFQKSTGFLIHKFPFVWWVWEIMQQKKSPAFSGNGSPNLARGGESICSGFV